MYLCPTITKLSDNTLLRFSKDGSQPTNRAFGSPLSRPDCRYINHSKTSPTDAQQQCSSRLLLATLLWGPTINAFISQNPLPALVDNPYKPSFMFYITAPFILPNVLLNFLIVIFPLKNYYHTHTYTRPFTPSLMMPNLSPKMFYLTHVHLNFSKFFLLAWTSIWPKPKRPISLKRPSTNSPLYLHVIPVYVPLHGPLGGDASKILSFKKKKKNSNNPRRNRNWWILNEHSNTTWMLGTGKNGKGTFEVNHWQSPREQFRAVHSCASMKEAQIGSVFPAWLAIYLDPVHHERRNVLRWNDTTWWWVSTASLVFSLDSPEYVCTGIYIWKVGRFCVLVRRLWLIRL